MPQPHALRRDERLQRADLIDDEVVRLLRRELHRPATETDEVGQAWMRADGHPSFGGQSHCPPHRSGITGVKAAGDARGADVLEYLSVVANLVRAETLADVAIEVDGDCLHLQL